jgi:hypothetical protein
VTKSPKICSFAEARRAGRRRHGVGASARITRIRPPDLPPARCYRTAVSAPARIEHDAGTRPTSRAGARRRGLHTPAQRIRVAALALFLVTAFGTAGYVLIEGMTLLDALFMTITTISTVGYREVTPLHTSGRIFTMALIVTGVGTTLYLLTVVAETLLEGHLLSPNPRKRRKLDRPDQVHSWGFLLG